MTDAVLVLNAGSSSVKFGLFDITEAEPALQCKGLLDEQQKAPRIIVSDASGKALFEKQLASDDASGDGLLKDILPWIEDFLGPGKLVAVGHRIVHGGREFARPVVVTDKVIPALEPFPPRPPLPQPRCLAPVRSLRSLRPDLPQIACFDTAFHH